MNTHELLSVASEKPKELKFSDIVEGDIFRLKEETAHREIEERQSIFYGKPHYDKGLVFPENALFAVDDTYNALGDKVSLVCTEMGYHWRGADTPKKPDYPNHKYHTVVVDFYKFKRLFEKCKEGESK